MKELGRSTQKMLTTKDRSSHVYHRCRAAGRNQQVEEHKHTHTHTHTPFLLANQFFSFQSGDALQIRKFRNKSANCKM